jgi:uncharacterized membrane protein YkvA (DUF1232 family)
VPDVVALSDSLALSDGVATGLMIVLAVIAITGLIAIAAAAYVIVKYRPPARGTAAIIGGLLYLLSPVDALPEAVLGPIGLTDDLAVVVTAIIYVRRLLAERDGVAHLPTASAAPARRRGSAR